MIKRIIFDIDGTLICNVSFKEAIADTLKEYDLYSEENVVAYLKGIGSYEEKYSSYNKKDYLTHFSDILHTSLNSEFLDCFFDKLKDVVPKEYQKIDKMLQNLSEKYELVILSNYFSNSQKARLKIMNIDSYFSEFHGEKIIKPNQKAYLDACSSHLSNECVMVGDNIDLDIKGAIQNGLHAIFVNRKHIRNPYHDVIEIENVEDLTIEMIEKIGGNI